MRPTIQVVAELAGVSRGTVDRVLNDRSYVSAEVRQRVLDAIQETGCVSCRKHHQQALLSASAPLTLGALLPNWDNQFRSEVERGIRMVQEELEDAGVQVLIRRCRTDLPGETLELPGDLVKEESAGISLRAPNGRTVKERVTELVDAGIPCIAFNSDLPGSHRTCFVGQDVYQTGRVAGELMGKSIPQGGRILATVGNQKFDRRQKRLSGFLDRLEELGFRREEVLVRETFNDYGTTVQVVSAALAEYPDLAVIYMANLSVSGCAEAVRGVGKTGQIRGICHDINEGIRQLLCSGGVDCTIPQNFDQQGYGPIMLLRDLLWKGKAADVARFIGRIYKRRHSLSVHHRHRIRCSLGAALMGESLLVRGDIHEMDVILSARKAEMGI